MMDVVWAGGNVVCLGLLLWDLYPLYEGKGCILTFIES